MKKLFKVIRDMEAGNLFSKFFNYINSSPSNPVTQMETKTRKKDYCRPDQEIASMPVRRRDCRVVTK